MWRRMVGASVLMAAMMLSAAAQEEPQQRWAVRLGVLYPTASNVRNQTDKFWVYVGLERHFANIGLVSLDYTEGSGSLGGVDYKFSHFALFFNQRQNYAPRLDLIGGIGLVYARLERAGDTDHRTRLGGAIGVAYSIGPRSELQLRYHTGSMRETNGIVLTLNLRF